MQNARPRQWVGSEEDLETVAEALTWLRSVDAANVGPETFDALGDVFELHAEISRTRTADAVERLRDRILAFPNDPDRQTLLESLAQHAADVDIRHRLGR